MIPHTTDARARQALRDLEHAVGALERLRTDDQHKDMVLAGQGPAMDLLAEARRNARAVLNDTAPRHAEKPAETAMVDAAMTEMQHIVPPLTRTQCSRLVRAAMAAAGGAAAAAPQRPALPSTGEQTEARKAAAALATLIEEAQGHAIAIPPMAATALRTVLHAAPPAREKVYPLLPKPDHSVDGGTQTFYRPDQMRRYADDTEALRDASAEHGPVYVTRLHVTELHGTHHRDGSVRGAWSRSYDTLMQSRLPPRWIDRLPQRAARADMASKAGAAACPSDTERTI
ncbi:hypothetical protein QRO08_09575 [Paracidovorax citrulli]|uniref:Uncharacterized protein n=2 Tax=Paracidovorax citrulli TaxID=80869 RepID=A1TPL6_PARC0|nr:hypothetical protein [Paracidovorax citrulli]ABM32904.1 hypothetical protein Aave_2328 [Paracidovorax citrulli AAC00-1]ATG93128.1 hypothetical protein CQB05_02920 [Paracidovorax citrulli]PVY67121.1 hypothetical protein C8E08_4555 [Paracidovorax citrulli]REG68716.1 hypothetical protein C8E07_1836 [Paracidovorax citrulli]RLJ93271.1 hypothetical protein C8E06_1836 [Paracidovorax citrulli]